MARHESSTQRQHRLAAQSARNRRRRPPIAQIGNNSVETPVRSEANQIRSRLGESAAQRQQRLQRQREYNRHRRLNSAQLPAAVDDEYQPSQSSPQTESGDSANDFTPVGDDVKHDVQGRLRDALGAPGLDEVVCAVCDRFVLRGSCSRVQDTDSTMLAAMRQALRIPDEELPAALVAQYNCEDIDPRFGGILLSRKGIATTTDRVVVNVCVDCRGSLAKTSERPPKYAIANGFFIGVLPEMLCEATWIEKIMTQLVTVVAQTRVMRGGRHRAIRSHCMVFDATPGPPATLLPRRIDRDSPYRVVLAGPMTDRQTDHIRKLHCARGDKVSALLAFFKTNNPFYSDIRIDEDAIRAVDVDTSLCDRIAILSESTGVEESIQEQQDSVVGRSDASLQTEEESECSVIERNVLLAPEAVVPDSAFVQRVADLNAHEPSATPRLRVNHSSRFASGVDVEAKMHAHLFPFGRGHPGETRRTPVSRRDCIKYYALLSSRRFAQDPTFLLGAFARLAIENMYTLTSVRCKRYSSMFDGYEALSREDLAAALMNNERRHRGQMPATISDPTAERFLKSVELSSVSVWGSGAERRQCRQEAFGYQTRFGQPSLFVTLTPNSDNSYAMAHYAGILSVDSDSLEARVPTRTEMKQAAMVDDSAAARLFIRIVEAFISHVLGVDPNTKKSRATGGLFGKTKAYYGMIETQGRGTLHIHFLIWLHGAPVNAAEFEEKCQRYGDSYTSNLSAYADSIITNTLPLAMESVSCVGCNAIGMVSPLPIPPSARKQRHHRTKEVPVEPLLVECGVCGLNSSSQHMIRQLLLQNRPPHWPPPMRPLTEEETTAIVDTEMSARSSREESTSIVRRRELLHVTIQADCTDELAESVLQSHDSPQLAYSHPDDDPFRQDLMTRLIEMTPPLLDCTRMTTAHRDYMLTSLVVNLNMHWWAHTGSCFKTSRATSSPSLCRYNFPRPSATLKRQVAHEYINGFNPVIMKSFKCNHDVQILFGGNEAVNRIYYCCKYVTKPQRQIDSVTAVALASFQRRQSKEEAELLSETPPSVADINRRRVTSMVYTFTNKQEIAGPLAALYIMRGSCCYSSETCAKLPLADVLKQLESTGDYNCTLVGIPVSTAQTGVEYRSASCLDDYLHRPQSVDDVSLYEYTMKCYRRTRTPSVSQSHLFHDRHPLSASHCIAFRRRDAVPIIKGPRLPRFHDSLSEDARENFAKIAMVLFKTFRSVEDLLGPHAARPYPWYAAFCEWKSRRSEFVVTIMRNMDDYHNGRAVEDEAVVENGEFDENSSELSTSDNDDDYVSGDVSDMSDDEGVDNQDVLSMVSVSTSSRDGVNLEVFPTAPTFPERIKSVIADFQAHKLLDSIAHEVGTTNATNSTSFTSAAHLTFTASGLRRWVKDSTSDSPSTTSSSGTDGVVAAAATEVPTSVNEIIDDSLLPDRLIWDPQPTITHTTASLPSHCGIGTVSQAYTLNELQHGAFVVVGTHLLRRWRCSDQHNASTLISDQDLQSQQLLLYMGGEGGTGKSRVINAIQGLCRAWERPASIIVCALTGKAASIVGGRTLASLEMTLKSASSHTIIQDVDCIVIDEVSMMSKDQLLRFDRLLRKAKRVNDVPFGGLHLILVGDFLQLPPVGADPLFVDPATKSKATLVDFEGFRLWRRFEKVVILRESVRFREDPQWGEGCSRARYGEWTPAFMKMINERLVSQSCCADPAPPGTVFVTSDNDTRAAINEQFTASTASCMPATDYPIRVVANFKGALNKLSRDDISLIMSSPDTKFGRMAPYLDMIQGMPIQITQNIRTKKGVANGTMGFLHSIEFPPNTAFSKVVDRRTGVTVLLPDKRPLYVLVGLDRGPNALPISKDVDPRLFPLFPDSEGYKKAIIPLTKSSSGEPRTLAVKIQQFPFVCAVGATVYKIQGESLRSMAVVDWKADVRAANKPQQAYLMVSRVVRREGLLCLKPFTNAIAAWSKPPADAINEDQRLIQASERTLRDFFLSLHTTQHS